MSETNVEKFDHLSEFSEFLSLTVRLEKMADAIITLIVRAMREENMHEPKYFIGEERAQHVDALARVMSSVLTNKLPDAYNGNAHWSGREKMQHIEFAAYLSRDKKLIDFIEYFLMRFEIICTR